jgi:trehalose 6-phosphate phosphatase
MKPESSFNETRVIDEVPKLPVNIQEVFPEGRQIVLFFDFDGTLSPIVPRPDDAVLFPGTRELLKRCASKYTVAVVSGRDTDDVADRVGIDGIIYAGSHGFSIKGPGGLHMEHEQADEILPVITEIEEQLVEIFSDGPDGVQVERKKYAITVHYRNADPGDIGMIMEMTEKVVTGYPGVRKESGKMIVEIKPDIDWHKGKALIWILEKLGLWNDPGVFPVYIGDDVTDEDAFSILHDIGLGIIVGSHGYTTAAHFRLDDVAEVKGFLEWLVENQNSR